MAERLDNLVKNVRVVLGERKRLERVEKKVVGALNKALGKIGYKVVAAKGAAPAKRRRRRAKRVTGAGRPRRKRTAARRRARAKK